jgi:hypothetical protein
MNLPCVEIVLSGFAPVSFQLPIDWACDPYGSSLWLHHFFTLRWLRSELQSRPNEGGLHCSEAGQRVLSDFLDYHRQPFTPKSPYYLDRLGDATMAERVQLFAEVYGATNLDEGLRETLLRSTHVHLDRLVSTEIYRPQTNHGLMIDRAILVATHAMPSVDVDGSRRRAAIERAEAQIDWLFTAEAVTREHSVSYQEYNLRICLQLLETLGRIGGAEPFAQKLRRLLEAGQEFLAYALDHAGRYFPLGDSFREPNPQIGKAFRESGVLREAFARGLAAQPRLELAEVSLLAYPDAGFAFIQRAADEALTRVASTASWHSEIHKQRDDTSFVLSYADHELLVDAGFSDRRVESQEGKLSRSEWAHNVVVCPAKPWRTFTRGEDIKPYTRLVGYHVGQDAVGVRAQHRRIEGVLVTRTLALLGANMLLVVDEVTAEERAEFVQLFHLAPGLSVSSRPGVDEVRDAAGNLRARVVGYPSRDERAPARLDAEIVAFRWRDRSEIEPTTCLTYAAESNGSEPLVFAKLISFGPRVEANGPGVELRHLELHESVVSLVVSEDETPRSIRLELDPLPLGTLRCPR